MTTRECYALMDADYNDTLSRLVSDSLIRRLLFKFAESKDLELLTNAMNQKDYETAFRISHSLKGVSLNLGFTKLTDSSCALCEELRDGSPSDNTNVLLETMTCNYQQVLSAIRQLDA